MYFYMKLSPFFNNNQSFNWLQENQIYILEIIIYLLQNVQTY